MCCRWNAAPDANWLPRRHCPGVGAFWKSKSTQLARAASSLPSGRRRAWLVPLASWPRNDSPAAPARGIDRMSVSRFVHPSIHPSTSGAKLPSCPAAVPTAAQSHGLCSSALGEIQYSAQCPPICFQISLPGDCVALYRTCPRPSPQDCLSSNCELRLVPEPSWQSVGPEPALCLATKAATAAGRARKRREVGDKRV